MSAGRPTPDLRTERLPVRFPHVADAEGIARYYTNNSEHLEEFGPARDEAFYTEAYWQVRIAQMRDEFDRDASVGFFVYLKDEPSEVIGQANVFNIARKSFQCGTLGYSIAKAHEGRGYMTEACRAVVSYAFETMNLHRVQAGHLPENLASGAVLRKLGFLPEGYARDFLYFHGRWRDHVLHAITNPDWKDTGV
ncbi:MAG: GNAT family N-acetyltransferase [Phycisphaera sp.]|nr:MAG: GNAT family N-acetyltransferase [Phycisphaera sp.]